MPDLSALIRLLCHPTPRSLEQPLPEMQMAPAVWTW